MESAQNLWLPLQVYGHSQSFSRLHVSCDFCWRQASAPFSVCHGVKKGCVLAPILFALYLAAVLEYVSNRCVHPKAIRCWPLQPCQVACYLIDFDDPREEVALCRRLSSGSCKPAGNGRLLICFLRLQLA